MSPLPPNWRPSHAYAPGHNERHAEDLFDAIKQGAEDADLSEIPQTDAWRFGLAFLREGYFWEAHEVLEPLWLTCPPNSAERLLLQGIIQLANAGLKQVMDKERAAERLLDQSERLIREAFRRSRGKLLALSTEDLLDLRASLLHINHKE